MTGLGFIGAGNMGEAIIRGGEALFRLGMTGAGPLAQGRWWTLFTAIYLHGGLLHILFNMMAFHQIASLVLQEYGGYRTFAIYTISGVAGYVVSYLVGITFTLGASAAVCTASPSV